MHEVSEDMGEHIVFTWKWWLLVILTILIWGIWIKVRRKESTSRLFYTGIFASLIASQLDIIGVSFGLWTYPINIILPVPPFVPWDLCFVPVTTMLFIQYMKNIKPFAKAAVFAAIAAFVVEPLAAWGHFYHPIRWRYCYSFPVFMIIYLVANFLYTRKSFSR